MLVFSPLNHLESIVLSSFPWERITGHAVLVIGKTPPQVLNWVYLLSNYKGGQKAYYTCTYVLNSLGTNPWENVCLHYLGTALAMCTRGIL